LRSRATGIDFQQVLLNTVAKREKDGFAAEALSQESIHTSMSALGG